MFFDTAACIAVNGTTVDPGSGGGAVAADFGGAAEAGAGSAATAGEAVTITAGLKDGWIPAAASTSAGVILPYGPVPAAAHDQPHSIVPITVSMTIDDSIDDLANIGSLCLMMPCSTFYGIMIMRQRGIQQNSYLSPC